MELAFKNKSRGSDAYHLLLHEARSSLLAYVNLKKEDSFHAECVALLKQISSHLVDYYSVTQILPSQVFWCGALMPQRTVVIDTLEGFRLKSKEFDCISISDYPFFANWRRLSGGVRKEYYFAWDFCMMNYWSIFSHILFRFAVGTCMILVNSVLRHRTFYTIIL